VELRDVVEEVIDPVDVTDGANPPAVPSVVMRKRQAAEDDRALVFQNERGLHHLREPVRVAGADRLTLRPPVASQIGLVPDLVALDRPGSRLEASRRIRCRLRQGRGDPRWTPQTGVPDAPHAPDEPAD